MFSPLLSLHKTFVLLLCLEVHVPLPFESLGEAWPSHPGLLDILATVFALLSELLEDILAIVPLLLPFLVVVVFVFFLLRHELLVLGKPSLPRSEMALFFQSLVLLGRFCFVFQVPQFLLVLSRTQSLPGFGIVASDTLLLLVFSSQ